MPLYNLELCARVGVQRNGSGSTTSHVSRLNPEFVRVEEPVVARGDSVMRDPESSSNFSYEVVRIFAAEIRSGTRASLRDSETCDGWKQGARGWGGPHQLH